MTVRNVDEKDGNTGLTLESRHLGKGRITFLNSTDWPPKAWQAMIGMLMESGDDAKVDRFVANSNSGILHFRGCNHLPHPNLAVPFPSVADARQSGYTLCTLCFKRFPRYSGFDAEQSVAAFQAASARSWGPPDMNATSQETIRQVGKRVVENWPLPLRGYDYRFVVLDSPLPNAVAAADGQIYMTSSLFAALENESEIEAVLAHEVAHVEMRHTWRRVRAARKASLWSALAVGITAAITRSANATEVAAALSNIASGIVLTGYGRDMEEEADSFAGIYFEHQGDAYGAQSIVQVLSKLKYAGELTGADPESGGGLLASHPDLGDRIQKVRYTEAAVAPDTTFEGLNDQGEVVATIQFQWQRHYPRLGSIDGAFEILSLVDTTPVLGDKAKIKDIKIKTATGWLKLDNKEDIEVEPGESIGAAFVNKNHQQLVREINELQLDLRGVSTWRRVTEPAARESSTPNWGTREDKLGEISRTQTPAPAVVAEGERVQENPVEAQPQPRAGEQAEQESVAPRQVPLTDTVPTDTKPLATIAEPDSAEVPIAPPSGELAHSDDTVLEPTAVQPTQGEGLLAASSTSIAPEEPASRPTERHAEESELRSESALVGQVSIPPVDSPPPPEESPAFQAAPEQPTLAAAASPTSMPRSEKRTPVVQDATVSSEPTRPSEHPHQDGSTSRPLGSKGPTSSKSTSRHVHFVQVGAFRRSEQTSDLASRLSSKGYQCFVLPGSDYFRVLVGPFDSEADALAEKNKLDQEGFAGYLRDDVRVP